jgi:hypothetical protein
MCPEARLKWTETRLMLLPLEPQLARRRSGVSQLSRFCDRHEHHLARISLFLQAITRGPNDALPPPLHLSRPSDVPSMLSDAIDHLRDVPLVDQLRRAVPNLFEPESTLTSW